MNRVNNKKFTLIELLVVMAILGILLSILLPSLKKSRMATQRVVCMSNMKQIGVALTMYLKDNNQHYPPQDEYSSYSNWFGKKGVAAGATRVPSLRPLNSYVVSDSVIPDDAEIKVAECPSEWRSYNWFGSAYRPNIRETINNLHIIPVTESRSLFEIKSPTKFVVFTEWGSFKSVAGLPLADFHYIHDIVGKPRWNQLFADGNVKFTTVPSGAISGEDYTFDRAH
ncbi:MAG: prepilin-type N-terminal cleavage/methylation domain-containing protein [Lentisphaerales bacterium]|nr:prepilin-type N-terminal cleavage/methylation domain-containing protein [Lentisphaerales bacterium]